MSSVTSSSSKNYTALFSQSAVPNWLDSTYAAIRNANNAGGLFSMLKNAGGDGSVSSFLGQSSTFANNFATISQNGVSNASSFYAQMASQNIQKTQVKKLQDALNQLTATQQMVQPKNTLDPVIYFANGSTLDTNANIMTMVDGTQYDTKTGAKYVDPASIIQMANGAYLDTKNNILTMGDGTRIDTVTGLKISVTA